MNDAWSRNWADAYASESDDDVESAEATQAREEMEATYGSPSASPEEKLSVLTSYYGYTVVGTIPSSSSSSSSSSSPALVALGVVGAALLAPCPHAKIVATVWKGGEGEEEEKTMAEWKDVAEAEESGLLAVFVEVGEGVAVVVGGAVGEEDLMAVGRVVVAGVGESGLVCVCVETERGYIEPSQSVRDAPDASAKVLYVLESGIELNEGLEGVEEGKIKAYAPPNMVSGALGGVMAQATLQAIPLALAVALRPTYALESDSIFALHPVLAFVGADVGSIAKQDIVAILRLSPSDDAKHRLYL